MSNYEKGVALIQGKALKYRVRRHPRARHFRITVSRQEGVMVTLPSRQPLAGIESLFREWSEWLVQQVDRADVWNGPVVRQFASGSEILFRGNPHRLKIESLPAGRQRRRFHVSEGVLTLELRGSEIFDPRPALVDFLMKTAKNELTARVGHWSGVTGLVPNRIMVGERKTRWGSCSGRGTLSFCFRLIMAPAEVMDAIVVHELCHLRHPNHGREFYRLLDSFFPDYQKTCSWLKENAQALQI